MCLPPAASTGRPPAVAAGTGGGGARVGGGTRSGLRVLARRSHGPGCVLLRCGVRSARDPEPRVARRSATSPSHPSTASQLQAVAAIIAADLAA